MARILRLTSSTDFRRVRRTGNTHAHPLVLLMAARSDSERTRVGVSATRSVGGAVRRNRAKRRLRAAIREEQLDPGWDLVLVARPALTEAAWDDVSGAVHALLVTAGAVKEEI